MFSMSETWWTASVIKPAHWVGPLEDWLTAGGHSYSQDRRKAVLSRSDIYFWIYWTPWFGLDFTSTVNVNFMNFIDFAIAVICCFVLLLITWIVVSVVGHPPLVLLYSLLFRPSNLLYCIYPARRVCLTLRLHRVWRSQIAGGSGLLGGIFAGRSSLSNVSAG